MDADFLLLQGLAHVVEHLGVSEGIRVVLGGVLEGYSRDKFVLN